MQYELILFDADDTLFDFKKSQDIAFQLLLEKNKIIPEKHYLSSYQAINDELWALEAQGLITKDVLKYERFKRFLVAHGIEGDFRQMGMDYISLLPEVFYILPEAKEVVAALSQKAELAIVTNGIGPTQQARLNKSGLQEYISTMVVSEECGFSKPDQRIFEFTLNKLKRTKKEGILMVGDRLETDIKGANNFGIDSCWFNPDKASNTTAVKPTFEIHSLQDLLKLFNYSA